MRGFERFYPLYHSGAAGLLTDQGFRATTMTAFLIHTDPSVALSGIYAFKMHDEELFQTSSASKMCTEERDYSSPDDGQSTVQAPFPLRVHVFREPIKKPVHTLSRRRHFLKDW